MISPISPSNLVSNHQQQQHYPSESSTFPVRHHHHMDLTSSSPFNPGMYPLPVVPSAVSAAAAAAPLLQPAHTPVVHDRTSCPTCNLAAASFRRSAAAAAAAAGPAHQHGPFPVPLFPPSAPGAPSAAYPPAPNTASGSIGVVPAPMLAADALPNYYRFLQTLTGISRADIVPTPVPQQHQQQQQAPANYGTMSATQDRRAPAHTTNSRLQLVPNDLPVWNRRFLCWLNSG